MLEINNTLIIQIANFLVLLFLLNIILYKPIRKILGQRQEEMRTSEPRPLRCQATESLCVPFVIPRLPC